MIAKLARERAGELVKLAPEELEGCGLNRFGGVVGAQLFVSVLNTI